MHHEVCGHMLRQTQHERVSACAELRTVRPELVEGQSRKRANGILIPRLSTLCPHQLKLSLHLRARRAEPAYQNNRNTGQDKAWHHLK